MVAQHAVNAGSARATAGELLGYRAMSEYSGCSVCSGSQWQARKESPTSANNAATAQMRAAFSFRDLVFITYGSTEHPVANTESRVP